MSAVRICADRSGDGVGLNGKFLRNRLWDGFEPPTNGLTARPTRKLLYSILINQGLSDGPERQNTLRYTPPRLCGKHLGNKATH